MTRSAPRRLTRATFSVWQTAVTSAPTLFRSWTAAEPMAPVAPLTSTCWPLLIFPLCYEGEGVVSALSARHSLLVREVRRHDRDRAVVWDRQVLGVRTE